MPNMLSLLVYIYGRSQQRKVLAWCLFCPSDWDKTVTPDGVKYSPLCWCLSPTLCPLLLQLGFSGFHHALIAYVPPTYLLTIGSLKSLILVFQLNILTLCLLL